MWPAEEIKASATLLLKSHGLIPVVDAITSGDRLGGVYVGMM